MVHRERKRKLIVPGHMNIKTDCVLVCFPRNQPLPSSAKIVNAFHEAGAADCLIIQPTTKSSKESMIRSFTKHPKDEFQVLRTPSAEDESNRVTRIGMAPGELQTCIICGIEADPHHYDPDLMICETCDAQRRDL